MALEQFEVHSDAPRSGIDQDLRDLEAFPDEERLAFLRQMIFHPMLTGDFKSGGGVSRLLPKMEHGAKWRDRYDPAKLPVKLTEPAEYLLPEIPAFLWDDTRPFDSVREFPEMHDEYFQTDEHMLMEIPQCYMVRIPKNRSPFLYMTLSECTAIVGRTSTDIYAAHVGYGMTNQVEGVIDHLVASGVKHEDIQVVANLIGDEPGFDPAEDLGTYPAPERRLLTKAAFMKYGIAEENLIAYADRPQEIPEGMESEFPEDVLQNMKGKMAPIVEVIIENGGMFVNTSGYAGPKKVTETMLDAKYIPSV